MKPGEILKRLPAAAQAFIEVSRADAHKRTRYRELIICKTSGYLEALRDVGLITDFEHRVLLHYVSE